MTYARRSSIRTNRPAVIATVALFHLLLGYGLPMGLEYRAVEQTVSKLKSFDVEQDPPPPAAEPPPPPPPQKADVPPPVVTPPPIVRTRVAPPPKVVTVPVAPPSQIMPIAPPPRAPPAAPPPPQVTMPPRAAVGDLSALFDPADYPERAMDRDEQGSVTVRLTVRTDGRVSGGEVVRSSGSRALDSATCGILQRRARFTPARDNRGEVTSDSVTQRIRWVLEG